MSRPDTEGGGGALPLPQVLAFASIGVPLAAIGLPFAVYMPRFYAGEMGLGLEVTGAVFMALRFWDIVTDPIMGYLVDRHPSPYGQIKHWLALSVPVLILAAIFLYMPGDGPVGPLYLVGWLIVLYTGFTLLQTPHQAWVPMLAHSYDERSRLFQWREIIQIAALLSLLVLPDLAARFGGFDRAGQIMIMGVILIIALPVSIGLATAFVPDQLRPASQGKADFSFAGLKAALNNGPLWRVLTIEVCIGIAIASTAATYLFAAEWGFGVTDGASAILMLFFIAGFCAIPFWMWMARRFQKHLAVSGLCLFSSLAFLSYIPLSQIGGFAALMVGALLSGLSYGSPLILARSMMADLVEREWARSRENRAGIYYALMTSAYKTGASVAVGVPFILLGLVAGFDPVGDNDAQAVQRLMMIFVGVPATAFLMAAVLAWGYPVTREMQKSFSTQMAAHTEEEEE